MLDPFRRSEERVAALEAIRHYEDDVRRLIQEMDGGNPELALRIASWPEALRGYGHVRARSAARLAEQRTELWRMWQLAPARAVPQAA